MTVFTDILAALGLAQVPGGGPRDFLRFFLSAADQARVKPGSFTVSEGPLNGPAAMDVQFTIVDPVNGAPQLRPLFPGAVTYTADPAAPGALPLPAATDLTGAGFATWRTRGALRVTVADADIEKGLAQHGSTLEVQPNAAFYSPIQLSQAFLLTTLVTKLKRKRITGVKATSADWPKHAVSHFLRGEYLPVLQAGAKAPDDDIIANDMPTVVMAADGKVTLRIGIARAQSPQDAPSAALDALAAAGVTAADPRHPRNAPIPARHVYRILRPHMIDAAVGAVLPDACLAPWPSARRFFPFQITRTWQRIPNFSVLFPPRQAVVSTAPSTTLSLPVPAHGVVYVPQEPGSGPLAGIPTLSLTGFTPLPTTFLDGATPKAWSIKSGTSAVALSTASPTHVILRRPLAEEVLADPVFPTPGGARCTYMSLRRATRAFVDHRITGGRLANEGTKTQQATKDLLRAAWPADPAASARVRLALSLAPRVLLNANPPPSAAPGRARDLEQVWVACFPNDVPAIDVDGTGDFTRTVTYTGGQMFYALWQTIEGALTANGTKRNFSNDHVGAGAPGAIVAIGLSSGFVTLPPHVAPHPDAADLTANVNAMLTRLTPGATLQFWNRAADYRIERSRVGTITSYGHSPLFQKFMPPAATGGLPAGIVVVDQFGRDRACGLVGQRIEWLGDAQDVWIAAQWDD